ncbi:flagellar hook-basal body protein [Metabacillus arenae]|uniref:Flagellar hook-basal body protein n=1 Tax=Metabacillus arenae TaxID=2771434 RepID=A0A926S362_9BACI|nr:flagellar hook-basal body protein [Metabacillus arenae]MBD1382654.1 flagellar hook-basal body protein [Metabacillus arenae]
MLRGFYTAAAGMLSQQRRTEMLSNNLANANTPGYKSDQSVTRAFPEMLLSRMDSESIPTKNSLSFQTSSPIGSIHTGAYIQELVPLFSQGDIRETGLATDAALVEENMPINEETGLKSSLLFAVQTGEGGLRYTRNGRFTINVAGELTLAGNRVLSSTGQPIRLNSDQFKMTENGLILSEEGGQVAQIDVRFAEDVRELVKEGNGLYRTENRDLPSAIGLQDVAYQLKQGFIERSNVDISKAYTDMMTSYRSFEANQKVLQAYDKSMDKAVNEIGRIG